MDGATSQGTSSTGKSGQGEVDDLLARHLQRQGFTGFDAQGREWRNGELVAAQPEEPKQKRAAKGGEIGPNGEHYKGGAFIATTDMPKILKDKIKQAAGDGMVKVTDPETGNTTRETPPSPNLMSISASMIGTFISPRGDVNHNYLDALEDRGASYDLRTKINELARKYKAGEKWVPINDFPEVAKGNDIYRLADAGLPIHPELLKRMPEEFKDYYNYQKSNEELKNDSAREDFDKIQIGDKFKDETGKEYVIHKKGAGTVRAWPLINGEPRPSSEKKFAITAAAKQHYPDHEKSVSLEDFTQAAPAPAEQNKEIETDPARQQQIKNSIAHGELILKYGKKVSGQKYSTDELNAVVKSVNSERAKLGEPGFTGTDAEGRQWQNGELVAAKDDEPTEAPVGNTDLFGNPTKPTPKGPETMPGLFGDQVPVAPDAPTPTAGEPLPGSDNPLDRPNAGRGKEDGSQDMFGLFGPGTKAKVDAINNGPDPVTEPTTPAPEPATTQPEPEKSNKAPGVKANDVPYDLAYNAHYGTSFVPEKRAKQRQQDYVNQMQADWEHLSKFAKTPEQKNILRDEFDRYKAGYLSKYKTALHAHSRTMSTMIAGPSKFPTSRNRKAIDSADKRSQEVEEFRERALRAAAKAINPELSGSPVLSRDANAVQTLQAQLDKLTQTQELMKKMNAAYKKFLKNPDSLATSGLSEKLQQSIRKFHDAPDASQRWSWHKNPFPAYQLTNNGANIRRIQKRIDELQKMKAQPEQEIKYSGNVTVEHDPEGARIRVKFPGKPSPEVIKKIKSKGFVWSPTNGAWQRQLNNASIYATDSLMQELGHVKEAVMPDPHAEKIKLVQAIIARRGIKPPQPKAPPATKKTPEASGDADPRVKRIRELMDAYC